MGLQACAAAVGVCSADETKRSAETCEVREEESSEDHCWLKRACRQEIAVEHAPATRAWLLREGMAECQLFRAEEMFRCRYVDDNDNGTEHEVFAPNSGAACGPLLAFCMSPTRPVGEERCEATRTASDQEHCVREEHCVRTIPLGSGAERQTSRQRSAACMLDPKGGTYCLCHQGADPSWSLDAPPSDESCIDAVNRCPGGF